MTILQERLRRIFALFGSLRLHKDASDHDSFRAKQQADTELINSAIAALIKPDQDQLRLDVDGGGQRAADHHIFDHPYHPRRPTPRPAAADR